MALSLNAGYQITIKMFWQLLELKYKDVKN
jgi:hypothetical protein